MPRFLLAVALPLALLSQTNTAVIRGTLTDPAGAAIAGARVVALHTDTGVEYQAPTNETGLYVISDAPAGSYTVSAEHSGFKRSVRQGIVLTTGQTLALDLKLELGELTQSVTVTQEAPQIETTTSGLDQLIESKSIADLPLADRRTMNVINMTGAAVFTGYDNGQKPNFILAGGRAQSQMLWIDGASGQNMRLGIGQIDTDPPVEVVSEIKVLSNAFSAEYGAAAGGVIIETTKSGTNRFHGSAYEYLRNDKLDAPGFFAPIQDGAKIKPELRYNVFGATLGGPVRRNRTFFFFDYEGQRRQTGAVQSLTVPTALQRAGNFSQTLNAKGQLIPIYDPNTTSGQTRTQFSGNIIPPNSLDPVALKLMPFYPLPNRAPDNPTGANNFRANLVNGLVNDFYSIKGDHNLGTRNRITGRYMYNRGNTTHQSAFPDPAADPANFALAHQQYWFAGWTRTLTPATLNDLRFNFGWRYFHNLTAGIGGDYPQKLGLTGVPQVAFPQFSPAGTSALGANSQERRQYPIEQEQLVDNLSTVRGKHALKLGLEARRSRNHEINLPTASGSFSFSTQPTGLPGNSATGSGLASMMVGFATGFTEQQTEELDRSSWYLAAFLQDDWSVTRNLTLNLGLRWETDTPMVDVRNRENGFDQRQINPVSGTPGVVKFLGVNGFRTTPYDGDWNNFGPRVGFAWKALGRSDLVVRGGFGVFYAHPFDAGIPNSVALGFSQSLSLNSQDNGITAALLLRNGVPGTPSAPALNDSFGAVPVGAASNTAVTFFETNRRSPYSEQFNLGLQKQFAGGMFIEVTGLGNLSRKLSSANLNMNQIAPAVLGPAHQSQRDRPFPQFTNVTIQSPTLGVSNYYAGMVRIEKRFSHGLNFVSTYTYSKFLENCNDIGTKAGADDSYQDYYNRRPDYGPSANDIRQRFTFASVYELPFHGRLWGGWGIGNVTTIQTAAPFTVTTQTNTTNAFSAGAQRPIVLRDPALPSDQRSPAQWFDTAAFLQPPQFQFGNEGRNILRASGVAVTDFSVQRNFRIREDLRLQFRGEFFNALNHTNFSIPGRVFGSPDFGIVNGSLPARQIQAGLRLGF